MHVRNLKKKSHGHELPLAKLNCSKMASCFDIYINMFELECKLDAHRLKRFCFNVFTGIIVLARTTSYIL